MNDRQTYLVIIALIVGGLLLAASMLQFDLVDSGSRTRVGLYTEFGTIGFILGYVVPVCLWALAIYLYFRGPGASD